MQVHETYDFYMLPVLVRSLTPTRYSQFRNVVDWLYYPKRRKETYRGLPLFEPDQLGVEGYALSHVERSVSSHASLGRFHLQTGNKWRQNECATVPKGTTMGVCTSQMSTGNQRKMVPTASQNEREHSEVDFF